MSALDQLVLAMEKSGRSRPDKDVEGLIEELAHTARVRASVNLSELGKIVDVKSPRRRALAKENDDETVLSVTSLAFQVSDERVRICLLRSLRGIEVPVASAILAWVFPCKWGVIDKWAWKTLEGRGLVKGYREGIGLGSKQWLEYNRVVQTLAKRLKWYPQWVDIWLYRQRPWST